jgi:hypothetical protein
MQASLLPPEQAQRRMAEISLELRMLSGRKSGALASRLDRHAQTYGTPPWDHGREAPESDVSPLPSILSRLERIDAELATQDEQIAATSRELRDESTRLRDLLTSGRQG